MQLGRRAPGCCLPLMLAAASISRTDHDPFPLGVVMASVTDMRRPSLVIVTTLVWGLAGLAIAAVGGSAAMSAAIR